MIYNHEKSKPIAHLAFVQGAYFVLTGLWPLVHMESFLMVTGPKEDLWLVRTVGMLAACIGVGLCSAGFQRRVVSPLIAIAMISAVGFILIDVRYVLDNVIASVYLADAAVEIIFFGCWLLMLLSTNRG